MTLFLLPDLVEKVPAGQRAELGSIDDEVNAGLRRVSQRRWVTELHGHLGA